MSVNLTAEQEAEAHRLVEQLKQQAEDPLLAIARLLVASDEHTLFGQTEFAIRKHALEVISQAYNLHLAEKKRLPGLLHRLPAVRPSGGVPRGPRAPCAKPRRNDPLPACLLLLPAVREGLHALG